jgi:hypothetical protein
MAPFKNRGFWRGLIENPDIAVIYLYRENLLQRYLSLQSLKHHNIVATEGASVTLSKMQIDIEDMLIKLDVLSQEVQYEHSLVQSLGKNPMLHISYEESFTNASSLQVMTSQVFEFLGVSPIEQVSSHRKILPKSLEETVENYDELVTALQTTRYAQYLD